MDKVHIDNSFKDFIDAVYDKKSYILIPTVPRVRILVFEFKI